MMRWLPVLLVGCWPYIEEPDPREDIALEADTDVDTDTDTDVDTDTDTDIDCPTPEGDLHSELGDALITGNTCVGLDDYPKDDDCGGSPGPDVSFAWSAPTDGLYEIDLIGSGYDTVLLVHSACPESRILACNDDYQATTSSGVLREFIAGQPVVIAVEGYNQGCGNFTINIREAR